MSRMMPVLILVLLCLVAYQSDWARVRINAHETEKLIETQCDTPAECRISEDGTMVDCWVIDNYRTIQHFEHAGFTRPSHEDVQGVCRMLKVKTSSA